jgi:uncharacterized protein with ParB-like and HNH nuclease domain
MLEALLRMNTSLISKMGEKMSAEKETTVIDDAEKDDREIPFQYNITSYGADFPVDGIIKRLTDKSPTIYIPPFQRNYVWTLKQASRFIESLLLGLPVPGVFLSKEDPSSKLLVIDGQQRLKTLQFFYDGIFKGKSFELEGVQEKFEGKTYKSLSPEDRLRLDNSIIHATIVRQDVPTDDESSIYHIFERLNTGGTQLQPQEIRACIYAGKFNEALNELNKHQPWRNVYGKPNNRLKDIELILRFFALYFNFDKYQRPMKEFLNDYMGKNKELKINSKDELTKIFTSTIDVISSSLSNSAFRPERALNAAVYDAVMIGLAKRINKKGQVNDLAEFKGKYLDLLSDDDFIGAYKTATSDEENVKKRMELATEAFKDLK